MKMKRTVLEKKTSKNIFKRKKHILHISMRCVCCVGMFVTVETVGLY